MEASAEKSDRLFLLFGGIVSLILGILLVVQGGIGIIMSFIKP